MIDQLAPLAVPIDSLHPMPGNPRQGNVAAVANSLRRFGQRKPIVATADGTIIAGNHTWHAARSLGWTEIAVVTVNDDLATAQAFALADNRTADLGSYDDAALLDLINAVAAVDQDLLEDTGWDAASIAALEGIIEPDIDNDPPDDVAPDAPTEAPITQLGDVWVLGRHRLVCGDSTEPDTYAVLMGEDRADLVVTDPPYNVAYTGRTAEKLTIVNDAMTEEQFAEFLASFYRATLANTKPGGALYVFHASSSGPTFQRQMVDAGWLYKQTLVWAKGTMILSRQDYHWQHEPILYGWRPGAAHTWNADRTLTTLIDDQPDIPKMSKAELVEHLTGIYAQSDVLREAKPARNAAHPTMKPVRLLARLIVNSSRPGQLVLDPFGGSGSTLMAAEHVNRRARMVELDPRYADVICRRWQEHTGQMPTLERTGKPVDFAPEAAA